MTDAFNPATQITYPPSTKLDAGDVTTGSLYDYYSDGTRSVSVAAARAESAQNGLVNSAIACIIAREVIEAITFIVSHIGAVVKNPNMTPEQRSYYLKRLVPAVLGGFLGGIVVTVCVAVPLAHLAALLNVQDGVDIGEGVSKTVASIFVVDMTIKLPVWFGISNYRKPIKTPAVEDAEPTRTTSSSGAGIPDDAGAVVPADAETPAKAAVSERDATHGLASAQIMALSLLWNTWREACEGGLLTAVVAVVGDYPASEVGASIGVGLLCAFILAAIFAFGARNVSPVAFGVAAAALSQLLSMGLVTGAVREFEGVYGYYHDGASSAVIYSAGYEQGYELSSLEFLASPAASPRSRSPCGSSRSSCSPPSRSTATSSETRSCPSPSTGSCASPSGASCAVRVARRASGSARGRRGEQISIRVLRTR